MPSCQPPVWARALEPWNLGRFGRSQQQSQATGQLRLSDSNQQPQPASNQQAISGTKLQHQRTRTDRTSIYQHLRALQPPRFSPLIRHTYDCACDPSPVQNRLHSNPSSPKTSTPSHNFRIPPTTALIIITLPSTTATRQRLPQNKARPYRVQGSKPRQICPPAPNDQQKYKHNHNGRWKGQVLGRQELWWEDIGHRRAQEAAEPLCPCWSPGKKESCCLHSASRRHRRRRLPRSLRTRSDSFAIYRFCTPCHDSTHPARRVA